MNKISINIPDADERGVSPVIGVILMVAITVILAAVIASFVLGFGDSVQQNVQAGSDISAERGSPGEVTATWISGGNADTIEMKVNGPATNTGWQTIGSVGGSNTISETAVVASGNESNDNEVTVLVRAVKGSTKTVIQSEEVTI